jgi:hypothetical protein
VVTLPSFGLSGLPAFFERAAVVAIAHLPIVVIAVLAAPLWLSLAFRRTPHHDLALALLRELRAWSRDIIARATTARSS